MMTTSWCCARCDVPQERSRSTVKVRLCLQGSSQAGPAGDDVAHEEFMAVGAFRGF
jgi:hypothetical protein